MCSCICRLNLVLPDSMHIHVIATQALMVETLPTTIVVPTHEHLSSPAADSAV